MTESLESLLPWRHPFLLIDRMLTCEPHRRIATIKQVTGDDRLSHAHRDGTCAWPGLMVLEGLNQTAALLYRLSYGPAEAGRMPLLGYFSARFRGQAAPGDTIAFALRAARMTPTHGLFEGTAKVAGRQILRAELAFAVARPTGDAAS